MLLPGLQQEILGDQDPEQLLPELDTRSCGSVCEPGVCGVRHRSQAGKDHCLPFSLSEMSLGCQGEGVSSLSMLPPGREPSLSVLPPGRGAFAECAPRAVQELLAVLTELDPLSQLLDPAPRTRWDAPVMPPGREMGEREWLSDPVSGAQERPGLPGRPLTVWQ